MHALLVVAGLSLVATSTVAVAAVATAALGAMARLERAVVAPPGRQVRVVRNRRP